MRKLQLMFKSSALVRNLLDINKKFGSNRPDLFTLLHQVQEESAARTKPSALLIDEEKGDSAASLIDDRDHFPLVDEESILRFPFLVMLRTRDKKKKTDINLTSTSPTKTKNKLIEMTMSADQRRLSITASDPSVEILAETDLLTRSSVFCQNLPTEEILRGYRLPTSERPECRY
jgi:hypothetical protein